MNDIRLDQRYLPMENGSENAAVVESKSLIDGCPSNNPCQGILCQSPFVCVDLWMAKECRYFNFFFFVFFKKIISKTNGLFCFFHSLIKLITCSDNFR